MKLLYVDEHLICENYEKGSKPVFENFYLKQGNSLDKYVEEAEILFVMKGIVQVTYDTVQDYYAQDSAVLIPPACHLKISTTIEDVHFIRLRVKSSIHLCNIQPLEKLFEGVSKRKETSTALPINVRMKDFLNLLSSCIEDGLKCKCFMDIKAKEVFYYFRAYYKKEVLREFFAPLLTKDYLFTVFILQNYRKVKTVQQFAELYGYSLSCFEKQFKKTFKVSAYRWMKKQKSKEIYHDLIYTDSPLIELTDKYDFSSLSQFCDFCKQVFGLSPGKIRSAQKCPNNFTTILKK